MYGSRDVHRLCGRNASSWPPRASPKYRPFLTAGSALGLASLTSLLTILDTPRRQYMAMMVLRLRLTSALSGLMKVKDNRRHKRSDQIFWNGISRCSALLALCFHLALTAKSDLSLPYEQCYRPCQGKCSMTFPREPAPVCLRTENSCNRKEQTHAGKIGMITNWDIPKHNPLD